MSKQRLKPKDILDQLDELDELDNLNQQDKPEQASLTGAEDPKDPHLDQSMVQKLVLRDSPKSDAPGWMSMPGQSCLPSGLPPAQPERTKELHQIFKEIGAPPSAPPADPPASSSGAAPVPTPDGDEESPTKSPPAKKQALPPATARKNLFGTSKVVVVEQEAAPVQDEQFQFHDGEFEGIIFLGPLGCTHWDHSQLTTTFFVCIYVCIYFL